jgi:hypothetical protein
MPEFEHEGNGRRLSAPSGSHLERALERDPEWRPVDGAAPVEEPEPAAEPDAEPAVEPEGDELDDLNRGELNELATELGVEGAEGLPNKDAVKAAILEAKEANNG